MSRIWSWKLLLPFFVVAAAWGTTAALAAGSGPVAHAASQDCRGNPAPRDPANPLGLATAPGPNPLNGAHFFVNGPRHGNAAGAIASRLGIDPTRYPDSYSWAEFAQDNAGRIVGDAATRNLAKIAIEPEAQRFSAYGAGKTPAGLAAQVNKIFCHNLTADPGSIPIINTFFAHPDVKSCSARGVNAAAPRFRSQIDAMAAATGDHPAVFLLEVDAFGSSGCYARAGGLGAWEGLMRYEVNKIGSLPHTVVYLEAGYSDANSASYTARALNASGIGRIRGFFTNDTHLNWTIDEIHWAEKISGMTHGAHYIVNTGTNGNGPLRPRNRVRDGNEVLCNPPGRALGPRPRTATGFAHADAFLWTSPPGNSGGSCNGGTASGSFWVARAIDLAAHANDRLGPSYPSQPY